MPKYAPNKMPTAVKKRYFELLREGYKGDSSTRLVKWWTSRTSKPARKRPQRAAGSGSSGRVRQRRETSLSWDSGHSRARIRQPPGHQWSFEGRS